MGYIEEFFKKYGNYEVFQHFLKWTFLCLAIMVFATVSDTTCLLIVFLA